MGAGGPVQTCNSQGQAQRGTPGEASHLSCSAGRFALMCSPRSGCCSRPVKGSGSHGQLGWYSREGGPGAKGEHLNWWGAGGGLWAVGAESQIRGAPHNPQSPQVSPHCQASHPSPGPLGQPRSWPPLSGAGYRQSSYPSLCNPA